MVASARGLRDTDHLTIARGGLVVPRVNIKILIQPHNEPRHGSCLVSTSSQLWSSILERDLILVKLLPATTLYFITSAYLEQL